MLSCFNEFDYKIFEELNMEQIKIILYLTLFPKFFVNFIFDVKYKLNNNDIEFLKKIDIYGDLQIPLLYLNTKIYDDFMFKNSIDFVDEADNNHQVLKNNKKYHVIIKKIEDLSESFYKETDRDISCTKREIAISESMDETPISKINYIVSNKHINEILINYILNYSSYILNQKRIIFPNFYLQYYSINIKNDYSYSLTEKNYDSFDSEPGENFLKKYFVDYDFLIDGVETKFKYLSKKIIKSFLKQITLMLHILQKKLNFYHGNLKSENIFIKKQKIDYCFEGVSVKSKVLFKMSNFETSSCNLNKKDYKLRFVNNKYSLNIDLVDVGNKIYEKDGEYWYNVNNSEDKNFVDLVSSYGYCYYRSFDYYTILMDLMKNGYFRNVFFSSEKLVGIFWNSVFDSKDRILLKNNIFKDIFSYKDINLKSNAVFNVIEQLR
jgi:hypothetical protein